MSANTSNRGYTYPQSGDSWSGLTGDLQELAEDIDADVQAIVDRPICQLRQITTGQTVNHNTGTVLLFGSNSIEDYDDRNWHSTSSNTGRVTPDIPGRYKVTVKVVWAATTTITSCSVSVLKNGTSFESSGNHKPNATNNLATFGGMVTVFVTMNGTTDYIEGYATQFSAGSVSQVTNVTASGYTTVIVELDRPS